MEGDEAAQPSASGGGLIGLASACKDELKFRQGEIGLQSRRQKAWS